MTKDRSSKSEASGRQYEDDSGENEKAHEGESCTCEDSQGGGFQQRIYTIGEFEERRSLSKLCMS